MKDKKLETIRKVYGIYRDAKLPEGTGRGKRSELIRVGWKQALEFVIRLYEENSE